MDTHVNSARDGDRTCANRDSLDGANYITLTANWRGGLWRFVE
jgi:hypothetical protein